MNNELKKKLKKYSFATLAGLIVTVCLLSSFNFFSGELSLEEGMKALSDSFMVPGAMFLAFGALVFVSTHGMFDGISYAGMFAVRALVPGMRRGEVQKYGDYKVAKDEKRATGYGFILIVGLGFLAVGLIFTILFFTL